MGDLKLFSIRAGKLKEIEVADVGLERSLQRLVDDNLESLLGVRFLASEFATSKSHGGRMDTLGIDEDWCPVIVEYKRTSNQSVINQGLFYLDWLLEHKADFKLLVMDKLGKEAGDRIDWSAPRLVCIAGDFNKYDAHAVQQISRNIDLYRYSKFGNDLLLLELVNRREGDPLPSDEEAKPNHRGARGGARVSKTVGELLAQADTPIRDLFDALKAYLLSLGDEVQMRTLKFYFAFRAIRNFACVEARPQVGKLLVYLPIAPTTVALEPGFSRDVRKIGHYGTGDLELTLTTSADLDRAKQLLERSYRAG